MKSVLFSPVFSLVFLLGILGVQDVRAADCVISDPPTATVTIEEYADLECPYCRRGVDLLDRAQKDFGPQVRIVFRTLPLKFHSHAELAARATHAVFEQSAEFGSLFVKSVFDHQDDLIRDGESALLRAADSAGADRARLLASLASASVTEAVRLDEKLAKAAGVTGTPSFVVIGLHGRETIVGAVDYTEFKAAIARAL